MQRKSITFRDVLESIEKIHKFVSFGEKLGKAIYALAQCGIDINKLNPTDFNSILKLATSLRQRGYDLSDIDLEQLREEFEDLLDTPLDEIQRCVMIIRRYCMLSRNATTVLNQASKSLPASPEAVSNVMAMFGFQPKVQEIQEEQIYEDYEETNLTERDIEEFKDVIEMYKKKRTHA